MSGTNGDDVTLLGALANIYDAAGGNDRVFGNGGDDNILGGSGNDTLRGNEGNDAIDGGADADLVMGGAGNDGLLGGTGNDTMFGGTGSDYISGGGNSDAIVYRLGDGNDTVLAGGGNDTLFLDGYSGPSVVFAPQNNNVLGDWTITGTTGNFATLVNNQGDVIQVDKDINRIAGIQDFGPLPDDSEPCFAAGTLIATARGEVPVESLRVGDLVVTAHGGAPLQPVVWIGHSHVDLARHRNRAAVAPILIKAGALADGVPHHDLRVSPEHAMFLDGRLVPARLLVNGSSIVQEIWCPEVTYWHVELPAHGLLVADGAVSESYFDDGNRKHFDNHAITTLFKDFASERGNGRYAEAACYPVLAAGPQLDRIRSRIAGRAAAVAHPRATSRDVA